MYLGIDLGTSAVKFVVADERQAVVATTEVTLAPVNPRPSWSEDDPEAWWSAICRGLDRLSAVHPDIIGRIDAIGLSGQMHGAVLLDETGRPLRPAILWNDGRSAAEARRLAEARPDLSRRLGVVPMPGFTGPKMLWLKRHEPDVLRLTRHLLLPKDYIRLQFTGEYATDASDAAGTWLFDQADRCWSSEAMQVCGVEPRWLPAVCESTDVAGRLKPDLAQRWGMRPGIPLAGGGGDTACGGVGIGAVEDGRGFVSLGTSAQVFMATAAFEPNPDEMVHAFCHAVPKTWCAMAALLNGASPLAAAAGWVGRDDLGAVLGEVEAAFHGPVPLLALPYLSGERTPHNDPDARGAIVGLTPSTTSLDIVQAVIEGVAFSLADGLDALVGIGPRPEALGFIGGGSRSVFWGRIIASVMDIRLIRFDGAERGPAFGATRLARLCVTSEAVSDVVKPPPERGVIEPDPRLRELYAPRLAAFRSLYAALRPEFARVTAG